MTEVPLCENSMCARFPCFETVLGTHEKISECQLETVDARGVTHRFILAVTYNNNRDVNTTLSSICPGARWRGDILAMKMGTRVFVQGLVKRVDKDLAKEAIRS